MLGIRGLKYIRDRLLQGIYNAKRKDSIKSQVKKKDVRIYPSDFLMRISDVIYLLIEGEYN